ncbi:MAG TPA: sugar phosphate nucleotidyltransferase [Polyangiaceae bacterium]|nr:sugar phosphate nucleotidyltransferase [Polyangiaceae bacterium]
MKVVLFCGGLGTRIREYSERIPKPLVEVGSRPILWHLMKYYAHFGHKEFILCLGYGGSQIKSYFRNYDECLSNDFVLSQGGKNVELLSKDIDEWRITLVDTGQNASIGERLRRVRHHLGDDEMFLANYADGLSDLDLHAYVDDFVKKDKMACFVSVRVPQSFHIVQADAENHATALQAVADSPIRVNGGFFVLRKQIFEYLNEGEELVVEAFSRLMPKKQVIAVPFDGFWRSMDTFKDKIQLDEILAKGRGPWQLWLP